MWWIDSNQVSVAAGAPTDEHLKKDRVEDLKCDVSVEHVSTYVGMEARQEGQCLLISLLA